MQVLSFTAPLVKHSIGKPTYQVVVVPAEIVIAIRSSGSDRVKASFNGSEIKQTRLLSLGKRKGYYLLLNAKLRNELNLSLGSNLDVQLLNDDSTYGLPMPAELNQLLAGDSKANSLFHALPPGKQRRILYVVGQPKTEPTRRKKAMRSIEYLHHAGLRFNYPDFLNWLKG